MSLMECSGWGCNRGGSALQSKVHPNHFYSCRKSHWNFFPSENCRGFILKAIAKRLASSHYQPSWLFGKNDQAWEKGHTVDHVNLIPVHPPACLKVPKKNISHFFLNHVGVQGTLMGLERVAIHVAIPETEPLSHSLYFPLLLSYQLGRPPGSVVHARNYQSFSYLCCTAVRACLSWMEKTAVEV